MCDQIRDSQVCWESSLKLSGTYDRQIHSHNPVAGNKGAGNWPRPTELQMNIHALEQLTQVCSYQSSENVGERWNNSDCPTCSCDFCVSTKLDI